MNADPAATIVTAEPEPPAPKPAQRAALARLAFGSVPSSVVAQQSMGPRHLAFLPPEALELDLDDPAQRHFGDYELVEKLGQGGMGVVYRARQRSLDRDVAIKLLSAGPWASPDFIERFRREAQSAARMQHPNIVAIYEIGSHDELNFFSMRLVQGVSLAHQLHESGPLPPKRAAQLLRAIAEALDYAHRLGVLHLDLKPANVLIDERGEPQVADFGLARRLDETLTRDNEEVSGTPSYMAPEQAQIRSHKLSQATDIYGLGAILYELLTGRPPFLGPTPQETLQRVITTEPVRLRELVPSLSPDLEAICLKCLAKDPGERYLSARALAEDLGRWLEQRPVSVRPLNALQRTARWVKREPIVAALAASFLFALLSGLAATALQWRRAEGNADAARRTAWSQRLDGVWQAYDRGEWFAALPRLVANLREEEAAGARTEAEADRRRLGILFANSPRLIDQIALGGSVVSAAVSPDGTRIAAVSRRRDVSGTNLATLHLIDTDTGSVLWHADIERGTDRPIFSADASTVFLTGGFDPFEEGQVMKRFDAAGGSEVPPPAGAKLLLYDRSGSTALLVDSAGLMQVRRAGDADAALGWRRPFEAGAGVLLSDDGSTIAHLVGGDPRRFELIDAATGKVLRQLELPLAEHMTNLRIAPDGTSLALATDQGRLILVSPGAQQERALSQRCEETFDPLAFSADSSLLATTCGLRTWVWDVRDGNQVVRPIDHGDHPMLLAVDARERTLFAHEAGNPRVYRLPPGADRFAMAMPATPLLVYRTERDFWSSDFDPAHRLLAVGTRTGNLKLWRLPPAPRLSMAAAPIAPLDLWFDGAHLVTVQGSDAMVVDAGDGHVLGPALPHPAPVWFAEPLADGDGVVTASGRELRIWDWRKGTPRFDPITLANTPLRVIPAPDGKTVLTSVGEYIDGHFQEHLQLWRSSDGKGVAEVRVPGPLEGARFAPDGSRLIGWRGATVWLRDGATLAGPIVTVEHRDDGGTVDVIEARMSGADELRATTRRRNINYEAFYWRWDARTGALLERLSLAGMSHRFVSSPAGGFAGYGNQVMAPLQFQRRPGSGVLEWLPMPHDDGFASGLAYDASGRLLAQTPEDGAMVIDATTGSALSPPLKATLLGNDRPAKLAFDGQSGRLVARSAYGRWLVWGVAPDQRPLRELEREASLYDAQGTVERVVSAPALDLAVRQALHARDPGGSIRQLEPSMADPVVVTLPRAPDTGAEQLDLGPHYTRTEDRENDGELLNLRSVPLGRQRFLGVDFDVRGVIQLAGGQRPPGTQSFAKRIDGIALPPRAAKFDLLIDVYSFESREHRVLDVTIHYRDGGEHRVELKLGSMYQYVFPADADPRGEAESWRGARLAWLGAKRQGEMLIKQPEAIWLMQVLNPEPGRELASLSLEAAETRTSPCVLAITVEPPTREGEAIAP